MIGSMIILGFLIVFTIYVCEGSLKTIRQIKNKKLKCKKGFKHNWIRIYEEKEMVEDIIGEHFYCQMPYECSICGKRKIEDEDW